jgi:hypothetical protein
MFAVPRGAGVNGVQLLGNRGVPPEVAALKTFWHRWVDTVELFALRRPARRGVETREFGILHNELIKKCRLLAESTNEVEAAFYRYLEDLVRPWLSPTVLARADREILLDLLLRCRQAERQLGGRSWARSVLHWALPALLAGMVIFSLLLGLFIIHRLGFPAVQRLRDFSDDLWFTVTRLTEVERLTFVAVVLLMVSIVALARTAKS